MASVLVFMRIFSKCLVSTTVNTFVDVCCCCWSCVCWACESILGCFCCFFVRRIEILSFYLFSIRLARDSKFVIAANWLSGLLFFCLSSPSSSSVVLFRRCRDVDVWFRRFCLAASSSYSSFWLPIFVYIRCVHHTTKYPIEFFFFIYKTMQIKCTQKNCKLFSAPLSLSLFRTQTDTHTAINQLVRAEKTKTREIYTENWNNKIEINTRKHHPKETTINYYYDSLSALSMSRSL